MDGTIRTLQSTASATVRVAGQTDSESEMTKRPSDASSKQTGGDVEFLLKGRIYRSVKCLSDNSGEAQVFWLKAKKVSAS